jgi:Zn-dependent peptidase ImmA (M78 family)
MSAPAAFFTPSPWQGSYDDIESIADDVRRRLGLTAGPDIDLSSVVARLGGSIEVSSAPSVAEQEGGSLTIYSKGTPFLIRLSPFTSPLRDRFTIGHELGHFFLHYPHGPSAPDFAVSFTRYGTGPVEWQANRFSAALLMPRDEFRAEYRARGGDLFAIAGQFGVSVPAVRVRASYLT